MFHGDVIILTLAVHYSITVGHYSIAVGQCYLGGRYKTLLRM
jgi:hypothetical protein